MKRKLFSTRIALLLIAALVATAASAAEYKPGEVIVKYKDGAMRTRSAMNMLYDAAGVKGIHHFSGLFKDFEQLTLSDNVRVQDAIAALMKSDKVEYAQPNYIVHAYPVYDAAAVHPRDGGGGGGIPGLPGGGGSVPCIPGMNIPGCDPNACLIPGIYPPGCTSNGTPSNPPNNPPSDPGNNPPSDPGSNPSQPPAQRPALQPAPPEVNPPVADPQLSKAYGLTKIGAVEAWKTWRGDKNFIVADIDTGIDYNHEDLSFNVWRNPHPTSKNDVVGYDFIHDDGLPYDDNEHGTHTAGTIGAVGGNGVGVSGVAPRVSIMALKFLSGEGSGTTADAIKAIDYAIQHGAKVLSNSWGGKGDDSNNALHDAIDRAKAADVLFIAAAGNDGTDNDGSDPDYPAAFDNDNLISVAATDQSDDLAFFSNYGKKSTDLGAPGVGILSTVPGNKYTTLDGTSMACPHVAGAAALIWSKHPTWNYKQVKKALLDTVDKVPALDGKTVTGGRLNVLKALSANE